MTGPGIPMLPGLLWHALHTPTPPPSSLRGCPRGFTWPASLHPQRNYKDTPAPPGTVEEIGLLKATQALFIVGASTAGHVPRQGPLSELKTGCKRASWLAGCHAHSLSWGSSRRAGKNRSPEGPENTNIPRGSHRLWACGLRLRRATLAALLDTAHSGEVATLGGGGCLLKTQTEERE